MSIDQHEFRQALSRFATGVTVVTTYDGVKPAGLTVSAFTSLSLAPPLVLICIDRRARSHDAIALAGAFAVNVLTDRQEPVARRFAARDGEKFPPGSYRLSERGLPLLADVLATIECRLVNMLPGGDHSIYVGEVLEASVKPGQPLLYYRSQYGRFVAADVLLHALDRRNGVG